MAAIKNTKNAGLKKKGEDSHFSSEENKITFSHRILHNLLRAEDNADGIANLVKIIETHEAFQSARFSVDKIDEIFSQKLIKETGYRTKNT